MAIPVISQKSKKQAYIAVWKLASQYCRILQISVPRLCDTTQASTQTRFIFGLNRLEVNFKEISKLVTAPSMHLLVSKQILKRKDTRAPFIPGPKEYAYDFVIAHEVAHCLQSKHISAVQFNQAKELFECQADFLAGMLMRSLPKYSMHLERYDEILAFLERFPSSLQHIQKHPDYPQGCIRSKASVAGFGQNPILQVNQLFEFSLMAGLFFSIGSRHCEETHPAYVGFICLGCPAARSCVPFRILATNKQTLVRDCINEFQNRK